MRRFRIAVLRKKALMFAAVGVASLGTVLFAATARHQASLPDFDKDGLPDLALYRPPSGTGTAGTFYALLGRGNYSPTNSLYSAPLGTFGDMPLLGDFDGDGKTDLVTYTPFGAHAWSIMLSSQNYTAVNTVQFGLDGDIPVLADYDKDGKTDIAVFRPIEGRWYVLLSKSNFTSVVSAQWGDALATPVPGDFDGDGIVDLAVIEPAESNGLANWYVLQGGSNYTTAYLVATGFGPGGVTYVPADYNGDGKIDMAYYDPIATTFTVRLNGQANDYGTKQFGVSGDVPVPADYDGDGKADIGVFRPSNATYYALTAASNFTVGLTRTFGFSAIIGDQAVLVRR